MRRLYTQITEWRGGDKSQQLRSPNTSLLKNKYMSCLSCLSCSDLGRAQNAGPNESVPLRTTRVPEPERLRPGRCKQLRAGRGWFPAEQPRAWAVWAGRLHVRERGQAQCGWGTASTRQSYLFAASLPPHSTTEQVSLKKKKGVHHRPLCIRAEIRHWRDQQTEEAITEGTTLEATGNRLKPCG